MPVVVGTGRGVSGLGGLTVSWFASVSAEPPRVLFCPSSISRSWSEMRSSGRVAVNVVGRAQGDVALRFADRGDRFSGITWTEVGDCLPVLGGALAVLLCRVHTPRRSGDHKVMVGLVEETPLLRAGVGLDSHTVHEVRLWVA